MTTFYDPNLGCGYQVLDAGPAESDASFILEIGVLSENGLRTPGNRRAPVVSIIPRDRDLQSNARGGGDGFLSQP